MGFWSGCDAAIRRAAERWGLSMVKRAEVVAVARSFAGVKWKHQGRTRHGIDCAGIPHVIAMQFGLVTEEPPVNYRRRPDNTYVSVFRKHMVEKRIADAKDGDVLVFADRVYPCHCGIRTTLRGQPAVLHAHSTRSFVIEESLKSAESVIGVPIHCFEFSGIED
jgi:cell wall-associated NlpC family hydrolase